MYNKDFVIGLLCFFAGNSLISCQGDTNYSKNSKSVLSSEKITQLREYISNSTEFNQDLVFLVDFSLPSNKKRFFVYSITKDSILHQGLVAKGSCNKVKNTIYSNEPDSHCSSLGKYKIGEEYYGQYGLAYKLHGIDSTNSNAYKRFIVLHAHQCIPNQEVPFTICNSWGCPTVSKPFLTILQQMINNSEQAILLWQYDDNYSNY